MGEGRWIVEVGAGVEQPEARTHLVPWVEDVDVWSLDPPYSWVKTSGQEQQYQKFGTSKYLTQDRRWIDFLPGQ